MAQKREKDDDEKWKSISFSLASPSMFVRCNQALITSKESWIPFFTYFESLIHSLSRCLRAFSLLNFDDWSCQQNVAAVSITFYSAEVRVATANVSSSASSFFFVNSIVQMAEQRRCPPSLNECILRLCRYAYVWRLILSLYGACRHDWVPWIEVSDNAHAINGSASWQAKGEKRRGRQREGERGKEILFFLVLPVKWKRISGQQMHSNWKQNSRKTLETNLIKHKRERIS